jgi:acyl carrier protein
VTDTEIREKVEAKLRDRFGIKDEVIDGAKHIAGGPGDSFGADSLDTVELIMELEEEFGIDIPDDEAAKLLTTNNVVEYLAARLTTATA